MLSLVVDSADSSMNLMEGESGIVRGVVAAFSSSSLSWTIFDLLGPLDPPGLDEGEPPGEKVDFFFLDGLTTWEPLPVSN